MSGILGTIAVIGALAALAGENIYLHIQLTRLSRVAGDLPKKEKPQKTRVISPYIEDDRGQENNV